MQFLFSHPHTAYICDKHILQIILPPLMNWSASGKDHDSSIFGHKEIIRII